MSIEYIARRYGHLLGGIDVEKALASIRTNTSPLAVSRLLGVDPPHQDEKDGECAQLRAMLERAKAEEVAVRRLISEAKAMGIPRSDLGPAYARLRNARKRKRIVSRTMAFAGCTDRARRHYLT